ncbi:MAG: M13 family metallopeptidase N-terminal domain-containing protein, partial [Pseudomonadota bacterium]
MNRRILHRALTVLASAASVTLAACSTPSTQPAADASKAMAAPAAAPVLGAWGVELEQRDLAVAPGDDFDAYANGTWNATFEIPADLSRYGMFTKLSLEAEFNIRSIVEDLAAEAAKPGSLEQKVGDYYQSWMNAGRLDELGKEPLQPYVDAIYAISTPEDLTKQYASLHSDAPFGVGIIPDPADTTRYIAFVGQSGLGMPDRDYYLSEGDRFEKYRAGYREYVTQMFTLAGLDRPGERADAEGRIGVQAGV